MQMKTLILLVIIINYLKGQEIITNFQKFNECTEKYMQYYDCDYSCQQEYKTFDLSQLEPCNQVLDKGFFQESQNYQYTYNDLQEIIYCSNSAFFNMNIDFNPSKQYFLVRIFCAEEFQENSLQPKEGEGIISDIEFLEKCEMTYYDNNECNTACQQKIKFVEYPKYNLSCLIQQNKLYYNKKMDLSDWDLKIIYKCAYYISLYADENQGFFENRKQCIRDIRSGKLKSQKNYDKDCTDNNKLDTDQKNIKDSDSYNFLLNVMVLNFLMINLIFII